MQESPDKITFFASYYEALADLEPLDRCELYDAIFEYAFSGVEPDFGDGAQAAYKRMAWRLIRPNVDSSLERGRTNASNAKSRKSETKRTRAKRERNEANASETQAKPSETEAKPSEAQARRGGRSGFVSKDKDRDKDVDKEEEEDTARAALPCMLHTYEGNLFGSVSGGTYSTPLEAIEASYSWLDPPMPLETFLGQVAKLCPPGCPGDADRAKRCYQCLSKTLGKYEPDGSRSSPYPLAAKIIADERGW